MSFKSKLSDALSGIENAKDALSRAPQDVNVQEALSEIDDVEEKIERAATELEE
jgi:hypothetical protein